jgi:hypothetical protein
MKVFLFFYIDWLLTQFDSALLTFLKSVLLISPVSGFFCLLSIGASATATFSFAAKNTANRRLFLPSYRRLRSLCCPLSVLRIGSKS